MTSISAASGPPKIYSSAIAEARIATAIATRAVIHAHIGIAIFPASVAKNISADSNVVVKKITPAVNVDYILSWDKEKIPSALAMKFIEHVRGLYS